METFLDIAEADERIVAECLNSMDEYKIRGFELSLCQAKEAAVELLEVAIGPDRCCVADALHERGVIRRAHA